MAKSSNSTSPRKPPHESRRASPATRTSPAEFQLTHFGRAYQKVRAIDHFGLLAIFIGARSDAPGGLEWAARRL
jgi:hypothetical protein